MLISSFFSCVLLLVQGVICSGLQDISSINEKSSKQLSSETVTYEYNHPPLHELNEQKGSRKEKSINVNESNDPLPVRKHTKGSRRRARPKASTPSLEIPVQVIYETVPTTIRSYTGASTTSPLRKTTRVFVRRAQLQSNGSKKIDIRQATIETSNNDTVNVTESKQTVTEKEKNGVTSTTEFPTRSRGSYFQKRTESPAPKVKILEEKNFVYAHSGNFHYSYLGGDGTRISSQGSLKSYDNNKTGEAVSGSVFYKGMDGNDYSLSYTADENGYRPIGAHLPTPPPVPPAIARALKYIADKSTQSPLA